MVIYIYIRRLPTQDQMECERRRRRATDESRPQHGPVINIKFTAKWTYLVNQEVLEGKPIEDTLAKWLAASLKQDGKPAHRPGGAKAPPLMPPPSPRSSASSSMRPWSQDAGVPTPALPGPTLVSMPCEASQSWTMGRNSLCALVCKVADMSSLAALAGTHIIE